MFLSALLDHEVPPPKVTVVLADRADAVALPASFSSDTVVRLLHEPTKEFPLKNGKTTYYVCRNHSCMPPVNELKEI